MQFRFNRISHNTSLRSFLCQHAVYFQKPCWLQTIPFTQEKLIVHPSASQKVVGNGYAQTNAKQGLVTHNTGCKYHQPPSVSCSAASSLSGAAIHSTSAQTHMPAQAGVVSLTPQTCCTPLGGILPGKMSSHDSSRLSISGLDNLST